MKSVAPAATYQAGSSDNRDKARGPARQFPSETKPDKTEEGFPNPFIERDQTGVKGGGDRAVRDDFILQQQPVHGRQGSPQCDQLAKLLQTV